MKKFEFDEIIKQNLISVYGDIFGYVVPDNPKVYSFYYDKKQFNAFVADMREHYKSAYIAYGEGKGGELSEKKGRYGTLPPKMASVASSSRFCYLALRNNAKAFCASGDVQFEHECRISGIDIGTAPQLDAYITEKNIYIEVKCHEIFDSHKVLMKEKYWDHIYGVKNDFGFPVLDKTKSDHFEIPLSVFNIENKSSRFDIKQFLCHLMGIASQSQNKAMLVYLFFKPKTDHVNQAEEIEKVFAELSEEIKNIFDSTPIRRFCEKNDITLMAVYEEAYTIEPLTEKNKHLIYQR